jgi:hypothetical protein
MMACSRVALSVEMSSADRSPRRVSFLSHSESVQPLQRGPLGQERRVIRGAAGLVRAFLQRHQQADGRAEIVVFLRQAGLKRGDGDRLAPLRQVPHRCEDVPVMGDRELIGGDDVVDGPELVRRPQQAADERAFVGGGVVDHSAASACSSAARIIGRADWSSS